MSGDDGVGDGEDTAESPTPIVEEVIHNAKFCSRLVYCRHASTLSLPIADHKSAQNSFLQLLASLISFRMIQVLVFGLCQSLRYCA